MVISSASVGTVLFIDLFYSTPRAMLTETSLNLNYKIGIV